jgi:hypothetical protein
MGELRLAPDHLNPIALWVMYVGLFVWIAAAGLFVYKGFNRRGRLKLRKALPYYLSIFLGIAVFVTGLVFLGVK